MAVLLALAVVKVVGGLTAAVLLLGPVAASPSEGPPGWYHATLLVVFAAAGLVFVLGGRADPRSRLLGTSFLLFATLFADRLLLRAAAGTTGMAAAVVRTLLLTQPIAFVPLVLWRFAWTFPGVAPGLVPAWLPRAMSLVCGGAGTGLFVAAAVPALRGRPPAGSAAASPQGTFWVVMAVLVVPSLVMLVLKWRAAHSEERRRLALVVGGLVAGTLPMVVDELLSVLVPAYGAFAGAAGRSRAIGMTVGAFALIAPAATAYAVAVDRVLDVRFILRRAVQYALARFTITGLAVVPLLALAAHVVAHRDEPVRAFFARGPALSLLALAALAIVVLRARTVVLGAIDRRFFREHYDARQILTTLVERSRRIAAPADLARLVTAEVDRALHLERIGLLLRDGTDEVFRDPAGRVRPLAASTLIASFTAGSDTPLDADLSSAHTPLARLPAAEREWLADAGARLLVPLTGSGGALLGILVLGEKRSELPFTREDRDLLAAVSASVAFVLENRIRALHESGSGAIDTGTDAARQCERCGRVDGDDVPACPACGGLLHRGVLPPVLAGKFRLERTIGTGGMGVVYLAHDLSLDRPVALKTLPRVAPEDAARLRREARAMASVQHPNLAVIHATEAWKGTPVLVLEFLPGGTLADRLRHGALPVPEVVSVGTAIGDVVNHLHRAGLLHRDIKPSNVGFAADGTPKLLDFGLARLATRVPSLSRAADTTTGGYAEPGPPRDGWTGADLALETRHTLVGTAAYLSPEAIALAEADHTFDLWSLAVTVYEAVTGRNPFAAATREETFRRIVDEPVADPRAARPDCPPALSVFLLRALARSRADRPATAAEFVRGLRQLAS